MLLILISILVWRVSPDMSASIDWRIDCIALASLRSSLWMLHMPLISCLLRLKWVYIVYLWCPFRCRDSETSYDHTMRRNIRWSGFATMTVFPVSCHKVVGQAWLCPEWTIKALVRLWFCQQIVIWSFHYYIPTFKSETRSICTVPTRTWNTTLMMMFQNK